MVFQLVQTRQNRGHLGHLLYFSGSRVDKKNLPVSQSTETTPVAPQKFLADFQAQP